MFKELDYAELQEREDDIFVKFTDRKWAMEAAGLPPTHDRLFCLFKWQLDEIEAAKAALVEDAA